MIDYSNFDDPHDIEEERAREERDAREAARVALKAQHYARFDRVVAASVRTRLEEIVRDMRARGFGCDLQQRAGFLGMWISAGRGASESAIDMSGVNTLPVLNRKRLEFWVNDSPTGGDIIAMNIDESCPYVLLWMGSLADTSPAELELVIGRFFTDAGLGVLELLAPRADSDSGAAREAGKVSDHFPSRPHSKIWRWLSRFLS